MCSNNVSTISTIDLIIEPNFTKNPELKTYKRRVWMLFLYCMLAILSAMMFPLYISMADLTGCYYGVSQTAVNWTTQIFMVVYIILVLPASFLINYLDLRWTLICGSVINTIGCAILFLTVKPNGFPFVITSCFFGAVGSLFVMGMPPFLAARWFPSDELSRVCVFGLFGNEVGVTFGVIFSSYMVNGNCSLTSSIEYEKKNVAYILTSLQAAVLVLLIFTFQNSPKVPPSLAQLEKKIKCDTGFSKRVVLDLMTNLQFLKIFFISGAAGGCFYTFTTNANNLMLRFFPDKASEIAWMTTIFTIMGIIGSIAAGYLMDYTHKFKEIAFGYFVMSLLTFSMFCGLLYVNIIWVQYITAGAFGFFIAGFLPIGLEYGTEIAFPASEMIISNLLFWSLQAFGFILIALTTHLLERYGPISSNIATGIIILICCIIASVLTKDYKRCKNVSKDPDQDVN